LIPAIAATQSSTAPGAVRRWTGRYTSSSAAPSKTSATKKRPIQNDAVIYKRAIYFLEYDECPRFVWLRFTKSGHNSATVDLHCIPEHAVGAFEPLPESRCTFKHNVFLRRELDGAITMMGRRGNRGGQPNKLVDGR
jgi:hypothetical protein